MHLKVLDKIANHESQLNYVKQAKESFARKDAMMLADSINGFFHLFSRMGLVDARTSILVEKIMQIDGVVAAKGCGAMLADTILVVFEKNKKSCLKKIRTIREIEGNSSNMIYV
jgi:hypothetical protein